MSLANVAPKPGPYMKERPEFHGAHELLRFILLAMSRLLTRKTTTVAIRSTATITIPAIAPEGRLCGPALPVGEALDVTDEVADAAVVNVVVVVVVASILFFPHPPVPPLLPLPPPLPPLPLPFCEPPPRAPSHCGKEPRGPARIAGRRRNSRGIGIGFGEDVII